MSKRAAQISSPCSHRQIWGCFHTHFACLAVLYECNWVWRGQSGLEVQRFKNYKEENQLVVKWLPSEETVRTPWAVAVLSGEGTSPSYHRRQSVSSRDGCEPLRCLLCAKTHASDNELPWLGSVWITKASHWLNNWHRCGAFLCVKKGLVPVFFKADTHARAHTEDRSAFPGEEKQRIGQADSPSPRIMVLADWSPPVPTPKPHQRHHNPTLFLSRFPLSVTYTIYLQSLPPFAALPLLRCNRFIVSTFRHHLSLYLKTRKLLFTPWPLSSNCTQLNKTSKADPNAGHRGNILCICMDAYVRVCVCESQRGGLLA